LDSPPGVLAGATQGSELSAWDPVPCGDPRARSPWGESPQAFDCQKNSLSGWLSTASKTRSVASFERCWTDGVDDAEVLVLHLVAVAAIALLQFLIEGARRVGLHLFDLAAHLEIAIL